MGVVTPPPGALTDSINDSPTQKSAIGPKHTKLSHTYKQGSEWERESERESEW